VSARGESESHEAQATWKKLAHEVGKKRRVKPLRSLVGEFDLALRRVAPLWMASPEVVAESFPLQRNLFDLVIFDEASQLSVARALPVLYRAKRVVIAGDEQQMPPSSFFESSVEDWELLRSEEEPVPESIKIDSLLVLAKRIFGQNYLGWHYRSQRQELIEFSNHAFYEGQLQVAANVAREGADPPIRWVPVKGVWADNRNAVEARKVVDLLHETLRGGQAQSPESVGIITFNVIQTEAVKDEIERRRQSDAEFAQLMLEAEMRERIDDRPVVKNIENIQGDERDVVIFSVGYAPDPEGVFRRQFGPLNLEGGENRLNVAITRARQRVIVICSFDPDELAVEASKNPGPVRFKQYLQYARAVSLGDKAVFEKVLSEINPSIEVGKNKKTVVFDSPFEESVFNAFTRLGYQLDTQVGLSGYRIDLGIVDPAQPARYCLGIECDGAAFHSGRSVRERDLARQRFLEARGWRIARVWSRNWWLDPEGEVRRIVALIPSPDTGAAAYDA
jgi:very-short-patch-repair endonuclease